MGLINYEDLMRSLEATRRDDNMELEESLPTLFGIDAESTFIFCERYVKGNIHTIIDEFESSNLPIDPEVLGVMMNILTAMFHRGITLGVHVMKSRELKLIVTDPNQKAA